MPSVELATAYVSLVPSFDGISSRVAKGLRPAEGEAAKVGENSGQAFASGFEGRTSKIGQRLGNLLKVGVATATAAVGAAGIVGIKTAAQLEQSEIAFSTMLGSGEKAKAFLGELSKFAAKTPFDLPGLQDSASSLISIGIDSSKVIPIMTTLGNVTSGMGTGAEGIQRATNAIQQMNAAGKISAEDLNQLRDAGIPVYDLLTAATGKTTAQISEMRDKGQLGREELEALMGALESGKGFERFNGLMEAQSQSLAGLWSTAKDTFSVGMADAIKPVIPLLKDGLGAGISFLSTTAMPALKTGLATGVTSLTDFTSNLQAFASGVQSGALTPDLVKALGLDPSQGFGMVLGEAIGGIRAFGAAWKYNDGEVTSSGFPGFMERAAYWTRQLWDSVAQLDFTSFDGFLSSVKDGGGQAGSTIASIGDSMSKLWPAIQEFARQVPDFAGIGLKLLVNGLAFLADHVDTIIAWMPAIVAAFVAWKVATIAITAAQLAAVPAQIALNVTRIQAANAERGLAAAHRTNAAAQLQAAGAEKVGLGTRIKNTAAAIAQRTATIAAAVAQRTAAAAQWVLNAAMSANPIGIIIIAITALVGALVWFFTQTELGREIITNVWAAIQVGIGAVVGWFQGTVLPIFHQALTAIAGFFVGLWNNIVDVWNGIKSAVSTAVSWVVSWVVSRVLELQARWNLVWTTVRNTVSSIWDGIKTVVSNAWTNLKNTFTTLIDFVKTAIPNAFEGARKGIKTAWDKVQEVAKKPVRFVVNTVINDGLIGGINGILGKVGAPKIPTIKLPRGFYDGGIIPGRDPGRRDNVLTPMRSGEGVLVPNAVAGLGGSKAIHALNRAARRGVGAVQALVSHDGGGTPMLDMMQGVIKHMGNKVFVNPNGAPGWHIPGAVKVLQGLSALDIRVGATGKPRIDTHQANLSAVHPGFGHALAVAHGRNNITYNTAGPGPGYSPTMKRAVSIHEILHTLGFPHSNRASIMQPVLGNHMLPTPFDVGNLQRMFGKPKSGAGVVVDDGPVNPLEGLIDGLMDRFKKVFPGGGMFVDVAGALAKSGMSTITKIISDIANNVGKIVSDVTDNVLGGIRKFFGGEAVTAPSATLMDGGGMLDRGMHLIEHRKRKPDRVLSDEHWRTMMTIARNSEERSEESSQRPIHVHTNDPHAAALQAARLINAGV